MSKTLFDAARMPADQAMELTTISLRAFGPRHEHWGIAWSGGKDSTALLTMTLYLLDTGRVARPKSFTVLYADTRMEIPPLWFAAQEIIGRLREMGIEVRIVQAPLDRRFWVYMLGRGVPPPNSRTLRWCTGSLKITPMELELKRLQADRGGVGKLLILTGVRQGESAVRDGRIAMSCGKDGAECGQGWYQECLSSEGVTTLAPILHWRVCHIWHWLRDWAPQPQFGEWPTEMLAEVYGGDEAEEINCRTGCICCPVATKDKALDVVISLPQWAYLSPLKELRPLFASLKMPDVRLRKPSGERLADGSLCHNQCRMGPLVMEARWNALTKVLDIQTRVNDAAALHGRPPIDILNEEEHARIVKLIEANTWPCKWTGREPRADEPYDDGSGPRLFVEEEVAAL